MDELLEDESEANEIFEDVVKLFEEDYSKARTLHLRHEVLTGERNIQTLANFRDTLDHLGRILIAIDNKDFEKAEEELILARDHLERIIYDGSKRPLEANIAYLENNRLRPIFYKMALFDAPSSGEYNRKMRSIRESYFDGRDERSEQSLEKANELAEKLKEETPSKLEVYYRLIILFGVFITLSLATIRFWPS